METEMKDTEYLIPPAPKQDFGGSLAPAGIQMIDTAPMLPVRDGRKTLTWNTQEYSELKSIMKMQKSREKGDAFRNFIARLREADVDIRHEIWTEIEADSILNREIKRMQGWRKNYPPEQAALYRQVVRGSLLDSNMRILGLDQSYTSSGIVVLAGSDMTHCEKFVSDKSLDIFARALEVAEHVCEVANEHGVEIVAIEGLAYAKNGDATRDLAGLQFTIVNKLREEGYEIQVIPPNTAKKVATGKGNAKKPEMCAQLPPGVRAAFDSMGVKKTTGLMDMSDAYWMAKSVDFSTEDEV